MLEDSRTKPDDDGTASELLVTLAARTRELEQTRAALAESLTRYDDLVEQRTVEVASRNRDISAAAERIAVAARAAKLGVWEWDVLQNRLYWDDTMYTLYGAQRDDFGGNYDAWSRSLHPDDYAHVQQAIDLAVRGEREYEVEFRIVRPDGSIRHIQASGLTSFQAPGRALRMIGVNVDVTERKQAEGLRAQLEEQLRVSQRMDAVSSLAGGIAHDFNNLLALVLSYTDFVVAAVKEGDPMLDDLMEIKRAGERAAALTRQLVAFSRTQILQPVPLSLNDIALGLEKMPRRILGEDIELTPALAPDLGVVRADPAQMEQVLMNLIVNARDAMPRGGKLTIETANVELDAEWAHHYPTMTPGSYVRLSVSDTGTGIDKALQPRIFEPFFTTKERGKGTGLGLSMVYGIITQSGGHVLVDSTVGSGTSFSIYLPRQQGV